MLASNWSQRGPRCCTENLLRIVLVSNRLLQLSVICMEATDLSVNIYQLVASIQTGLQACVMNVETLCLTSHAGR